MIAFDTCAPIVILPDEQEARGCADALAANRLVLISAATVSEALVDGLASKSCPSVRRPRAARRTPTPVGQGFPRSRALLRRRLRPRARQQRAVLVTLRRRRFRQDGHRKRALSRGAGGGLIECRGRGRIASVISTKAWGAVVRLIMVGSSRLFPIDTPPKACSSICTGEAPRSSSEAQRTGPPACPERVQTPETCRPWLCRI